LPPTLTDADFNLGIKKPEEKLEQLRRTSVLEFEHLKSPDHPQPPLRALPAHSVPTGETTSPLKNTDTATDKSTATDTTAKAAANDKPVFKELDFGGDGATAGAKEDVLSPTET
jgi:glycogenin